jgi:hypothetical protein
MLPPRQSFAPAATKRSGHEVDRPQESKRSTVVKEWRPRPAELENRPRFFDRCCANDQNQNHQ